MTTIERVAALLWQGPHSHAELVTATGSSPQMVSQALHYLRERPASRLCTRALPKLEPRPGRAELAYWLEHNR